MMKLARIGDPQLSPDGKTVAFTVQTVDVDRRTQKPQQIWTVPLDGGTPRKLTIGRPPIPAAMVARLQAHLLHFDRADAADLEHGRRWQQPQQVTRLSTEADGELVSPDGKNLVFTSDVYPDCPDDACNQKNARRREDSKVQARINTALLYRHWTTWEGSARAAICSRSRCRTEASKDLTPGTRDVPPFSLGGPDDYAISPDSNEVCFAMNTDDVPATSTNYGPLRGAHRGGTRRRSPQSRRRQFAVVFAGRQVSRLPLAGPRRL